MTGRAAAAAGALLAASFVAAGTLLLRARVARTTAALLLGGAAALVVALSLGAADAPEHAVGAAGIAGTVLAFPLAMVAYPRLRGADAGDAAAALVVAAAAVLALVDLDRSDAPGFMLFTAVVAVVGRLWWRIERAPAGERRPFQWLAFALIAAGTVAGFAVFAAGDASAGTGGAVAVGCFAAVPPAMVVGLRRPDLVDVRGLIVHAVVVGATVSLYVSVFVGAAAALRVSDDDRPTSLGVLGLVGAGLALAFHPTTVVLRGVIDQLLFGDRPDPLRAATRVVDRIGDDPALALQAIREALVLPYASLRADGRELAASGTAVTHTRTLPLPLGGGVAGEIVVGLRAGDLRLAASDADVLRIVAPLLAQTIRARALAADLQASRGEAIAAIEEERRRLRRDLHDGLGPTLTGVAFATDAARNRLKDDDPAAADELLARLRADTADAIAEIRRLVEGLRPPALDELGLVAALRQQAHAMHTAAGAPLAVTIEAPDPMPELPAAAEVAAYRIVVEALTNVARHAGSPTAHVTLAVDGAALEVSVADAGRSPEPWRPGVGMSSMRERAEQVGGALTAAAGPDGGRVRASIPLA